MRLTRASLHPDVTDISADPFLERRAPRHRVRLQLLGGSFEFASDAAELHRLVLDAYAGLPKHRLAASGSPRLEVRLSLARSLPAAAAHEPSRIGMLSGAQLLCGATADATFAVLAPDARRALVVVAPGMLRFPYHVRYELIEFTVFTLAARAQGLVPLHAACIAANGRGVLLMGDSGSGKSTAALLWALGGGALIAEDSVFAVPDTLQLTGVANFLHVTRESLSLLPAADAALVRRAPRIRRRSGVEKFEVDLRQGRFCAAPQPVRTAALVFLSARVCRDGAALRPLTPAQALQRVRRCQPYAAGQVGWTRFTASLRAVPAFELRRGAYPAATREQLAALLARGAAWR